MSYRLPELTLAVVPLMLLAAILAYLLLVGFDVWNVSHQGPPSGRTDFLFKFWKGVGKPCSWCNLGINTAVSCEYAFTKKKNNQRSCICVCLHFSPFNCNFSFLQINTLDQSSCRFLSIFMWYRQHQETKTACFTWQNTHSEGTLIFFQTNIFQYFCYCISF